MTTDPDALTLTPSLETGTSRPVTSSPAAATVPAAAGAPPAFHPCEQCGAPLDARQRYCVVCGTRHKLADDPAARFLAGATKRRRTSAATAAVARSSPHGSAPLATAALIALIPIALGGGVLIGRSSGGGDGKLIAALRTEKAPVIQYSGAAAAPATAASAAVPAASTAAAAPVSRPASTFTLSRGYTVELGTLPGTTSASAAAAAERADRRKGANAVGIISPSDFTVKPRPPGGDYVVYSGSFQTAAAAHGALTKLQHAFPHALVVQVTSVSASTAGAGKVLTKTRYGSARQVSGYKPDAAALAQGAQVANQDAHNTGTAASGAGLPDVVAVP